MARNIMLRTKRGRRSITRTTGRVDCCTPGTTVYAKEEVADKQKTGRKTGGQLRLRQGNVREERRSWNESCRRAMGSKAKWRASRCYSDTVRALVDECTSQVHVGRAHALSCTDKIRSTGKLELRSGAAGKMIGSEIPRKRCSDEGICGRDMGSCMP